MKIERIEQIQLKMPFKHSFQTSYGELTHKWTSIYIVHGENGLYGLGELDALEHPDYIEETFDSGKSIIEKYLIPKILHQEWTHPDEISDWFKKIQGNFMAKSALETAVWDLYARGLKRPLHELIGGQSRPIEVGISVGITENLDQLVTDVGRYIQQGYRRIKLKIQPGYDIVPLTRLREAYPNAILMADANSAYQTVEDWSIFLQLDQLDLAMIEQPFDQRDYVLHAKLQKKIKTRLCLDESIRSLADVQTAVALGSCRAINLKIPRVGGLTEARRIWEYCHTKNLLVWIGGMYEAGVGRALNLQVATVPTLTFPGDLSASDRYFLKDIVKPAVKLDGSKLAVSSEPGIGVELDLEAIKQYLIAQRIFK